MNSFLAAGILAAIGVIWLTFWGIWISDNSQEVTRKHWQIDLIGGSILMAPLLFRLFIAAVFG